MTTPPTSLIGNRTHIHVQRLLERATQIRLEHNWEGQFVGFRGSAANCIIRVKARIGLQGDLFEGAGRGIDMPTDISSAAAEFTISGTIGVDSLGFRLWFAAPKLAREAFVGTGELAASGREMRGDWSVGCFFPGECGCAGGGGTFHLKRID